MINIQNPSSPLMERLHFFHDWIILFVVSIATFVLLLMRTRSSLRDRSFVHSELLESVWIAPPVVILIYIGIPSLRLLYVRDEGDASLNVSIIGRQWYWQYDMIFSYYCEKLRLLEVTDKLPLPLSMGCNMLITSSDVLHSWALPSIGAKGDAVPGRINRVFVSSNRPGIFYGQCREICGRNHSFIPIAVECSFN